MSSKLLGAYYNRYGGAATGRYGPGLTGHVPSESRLTFWDKYFPFSDCGNIGYYCSIVRTPQYLLLSSICYHVLVYINMP